MKEIKFKAVMQRQDGAMYVSKAYGSDSSFLSYLFDFENNRWDKFLETITTEKKFVKLFPDDDEDLKGWTHIENIQYTGLKDKNNIEIHEGDIVQVEGLGVGIIEYIESYFRIFKPYIFSINLCNYTSTIELEPKNKVEVIGNIYENKDLLSEVK